MAAGTTVTWTNAGAVIHTTTSSNGLWDSGVLDSGQTFNFTFTQAGSFPFFCNIHPSMMATITVTGPQAAQPAPTRLARATSAPTLQPAPTATAAPTSTTQSQPTATPTPPTEAQPTAAPTPTTEAQPTATLAPEGMTPPLTIDLDMKDFRHQDATVQAGTTVVWTNRDVVQHTVTSGSPSDPDPGSLFDSGSGIPNWVVQGEIYTFTFNEAGVFPYYCRVHGAPMSGTVTVTPAEPEAVGPTPTVEPTPMAVSTEAVIRDFAHEDLSVKVGTTVVWTNRGNATHTTTASEGQWDSGRLPAGQSFSFTFTKAGTFNYLCAIHRSMTAEVTVNN